IGKISKAITATPNKKTPIQIKLASLGKWLVLLSVLLCALVIAIGLAYKRDTVTTIKIGISLAVSVIPEGLVAVVTGMAPLPDCAINITMALGVVRMSKRNAIVRKLPSVETLGSVNVICSDKTGTLTEGKMGTESLWTADNGTFAFTHSTSMDPNVGVVRRLLAAPLAEALREAESPTDDTISAPPSVGSPRSQSPARLSHSPTRTSRSQARSSHSPTRSPSPTRSQSPTRAQSPAFALQTASEDDQLPKDPDRVPPHLLAASMVAALCSNAVIAKDEETGGWKPSGDPTEIAMVIAAQKAGFSREWFQDKVGLKKLGEYAFDRGLWGTGRRISLNGQDVEVFYVSPRKRDRKLMSTIYTQPESDPSTFPHPFPPHHLLRSLQRRPRRHPPQMHNLPRALPILPRYGHRNTSRLPRGTTLERLCRAGLASQPRDGGLRLSLLGLAQLKVAAEEAAEIVAAKKETAAESDLCFCWARGAD
ncbi:hypothetical protein BDK51DRAFT_46697, partial [Blyttiomyces helicus]